MVQALSQFGESTSGVGALGFDLTALVIQLITFVLAFLILRRYAFEPIIKVLRERKATIETGVKLGEEMKQERAKLEDTISKTLQETRTEADAIIAGAQDTSRQMIKEAEDKARDKSAQLLKEAESRITQETARARKALEKDVVELVSVATEAIIHEKVDSKKDAQLVRRALEEQEAAR